MDLRTFTSRATYDATTGNKLPDVILDPPFTLDQVGARGLGMGGTDVRDEVFEGRLDGKWRGGATSRWTLRFGVDVARRAKARTVYGSDDGAAFSSGSDAQKRLADAASMGLAPADSLLTIPRGTHADPGQQQGAAQLIRVPYSQISIPDSSGSFLASEPGNFPRHLATFDIDQLFAFYRTLDPAAFELVVPRLRLRDSFTVQESVYTGYASASLDGDLMEKPFVLAVGLRGSMTRVRSSAFQSQVVKIHRDAGNNVTQIDHAEPMPIASTGSYFSLLPSATFRIDLADELVLRAAASRTLTRPLIDKLTPTYTVNASANGNRIAYQNPDLNPFTAIQGDVSLEWYFSEAGAITGAVYAKRLEGFITSSFEEEVARVADDPNLFDVSMPVNGEKTAKLAGFELGYQHTFDMLPKPSDGLGLRGNFTYSWSDGSTDGPLGQKLPMVGLSARSYNFVLFYDRHPFSGRIAYTARDRYLERPNPIIYRSPYAQLDLSLSYHIGEHLTMFANGINVLDTPSESYDTTPDRLTFLGYTGRQLSMGVRGRLWRVCYDRRT